MLKALATLLNILFQQTPSFTMKEEPLLLLQQQHPPLTPSDMFDELAAFCRVHNITKLDTYGDFQNTSSFIRNFEKEIANELSMADAVFLPSGVMAQSIALLIHQQINNKPNFACHPTSHLLLHEEEGYRKLLQMEPIVIKSKEKDGISGPPMRLEHVVAALNARKGADDAAAYESVHTLLLELPHRELGGKLTPWQEVEEMGAYCRQHGVAFHCDGARLFEASAGYGISLRGIAKPFDSVYLSCYKGLGGMSGAFLLGKTDEFCQEARCWLRRFGGNLYTQAPAYLSARIGYERYYLLQDFQENTNMKILSFHDKRQKLAVIVKALQRNERIASSVCFEPSYPQTSMIHGYLKSSMGECTKALDAAQKRTGIRVLHRLREARNSGDFQTMFEWNIGQHNGHIKVEEFLRGWIAFVDSLGEGSSHQA